MRFLYAKLAGYIGLYNGIGVDEIEIDFTKCKNKICLIAGENGKGKSTIINALGLLPDGNNMFIPTATAQKILKIQDGDNVYDIQIVHPLDKNGSRGNTKVSLQKNGIELNPNGNVTSYKDIIFTEFDMDANYLALSKVSSYNRGLADKKPAERKKIMSSLISSLDVYNNIYKILNKKANIFKSYINTIGSKIQNIGDEANLRSALNNLKTRQSRLNESIEECKVKIVEAQTLLNVNDPDGSKHKEYDEIINGIRDKELNTNSAYSKLSRYIDSIGFNDDINNIQSIIDTKTKELKVHEDQKTDIKISLEKSLSDMTFINTEIDKLRIKLNKLESNKGEDLEESIERYKRSINVIQESFNNLGIKNIDDISKDEIDHTIEIIDKIVNSIDVLYSIIDTSMTNDIKKYFKSASLEQDITGIVSEIESLKEQKTNYTIKLSEIKADRETISILSNRPKNCKDDSCVFISKAVVTKNKYSKGIDKVESDVISNMDKVSNKIIENQDRLNYFEILSDILSKIGAITDLIHSNLKLLKKFTVTLGIVDENTLIDNICNQYLFNELRSLNQYSDISNDIVEYKSIEKVLQSLEAEYQIYLNNVKQINEIKQDISDKETLYNSTKEEYERISIAYKSEEDIINNISEKISEYNTLIELYNEWKKESDELEIMKSKKDELSSKFQESLTNMEKINDLKDVINATLSELEPIDNDIKTIESQLTLLDTYNSEYNMYKEKYDFVDTLRKYSSPTSGSIQSLFMSIYMDKTLDMVNQLLGMMFNGEYRILQYVINADEFRIPFIGNGLTVDDISNGSTSQVCIMGLIINLVLAYTSSGKYNIISLDEIGSGLDAQNQYLFIDVIRKMIEILDIDQLFMISHAIGSVMDSVDVILLSDDINYTDLYSNANIIYQFTKSYH